jgi:hypothetical protein
LPKPAIAQGIRQLTMVTDRGDGPGGVPIAQRLAKRIAHASHGRIRIEVSASGWERQLIASWAGIQAHRPQFVP